MWNIGVVKQVLTNIKYESAQRPEYATNQWPNSTTILLRPILIRPLVTLVPNYTILRHNIIKLETIRPLTLITMVYRTHCPGTWDNNTEQPNHKKLNRQNQQHWRYIVLRNRITTRKMYQHRCVTRLEYRLFPHLEVHQRVDRQDGPICAMVKLKSHGSRRNQRPNSMLVRGTIHFHSNEILPYTFRRSRIRGTIWVNGKCD